jgi:hypothetical protein
MDKIDFEEVVKKMAAEAAEFRKNPVFDIHPDLAAELQYPNKHPQCPFCDKDMDIEFKTMLTCKDCPVGFYVNSFKDDVDRAPIDISKFTVTFGNTAARVARVYSLKRGVVIFQRIDDPIKLMDIKRHDMKEDTVVPFENIKFNYKDIDSIINKLKTYLMFG